VVTHLSGSAQATSTAGPAPYPAFRGLNFEEDESLLLHLSGLTVPRANGRNFQKVLTFFRDPQREEQTTTYPYIMIDKLPTQLRRYEEHRGYIPWCYEAYTGNALVSPGMTEFPIPVYFCYQITTAALNIQHDVIVNDILMTTKLPFRFGQMTCPSGTVRRIDVNSGPVSSNTINPQEQRVFRKVWSINVAAEILTVDPSSIVTEVGLEVIQTNP
jgi:hypothetical protein